MRITRPARFAIAVVGVALLVAAGCGKDDKSESSTTTTVATTATTTGGATVRVVVVNKAVQQELADVGCYSGKIDGIFGPETDAAILAFQAGDGLTVDGELGPETKAALAQAVANKQKVCTSSGTSSTTSTTTPANAPCTATALAKALPAGTEITNYACSEGYAGVAGTSGGADTTALLQADGASWKDLGTKACGGASAGYPPAVLEIACPA